MRFAAALLNLSARLLNILFILLASVLMIPSVIGIRPFIVMSGSMEPEIMTGSIAFIDTKNQEADAGDIITFHTGDALVTHRVFAIRDGLYQTKGDANDQPDVELVSAEQVEGKYRYNIPKLGFLLASLGKKGLIGAVMWLLGLNALSFLMSASVKREQVNKDDDRISSNRGGNCRSRKNGSGSSGSRSSSNRVVSKGSRKQNCRRSGYYSCEEETEDGIFIMDQMDFEMQQKQFQEEYLL